MSPAIVLFGLAIAGRTLALIAIVVVFIVGVAVYLQTKRR